jgi:hypothetical protein
MDAGLPRVGEIIELLPPRKPARYETETRSDISAYE